MRLKFSLWALYDADNDLFENLVLPDGIDNDEAGNMVEDLMAETLDMDLIYTDANYMKWYIGVWSRKKLWEWQKIWDALQVAFSPIENYDRIEDTTDAKDITDTKNWADDHTRTLNLSDDHTTTNNLAHDTTETRNLQNSPTTTVSTAAYDSSSYQAKEQTAVVGSDTGTVRNAGTDTGTQRNAGTNSGTERNAGTDTGTLRSAGTNTRTSHIHGNIGVTKSTEMLKEYVDLYNNICFEDVFITDFIRQFIRMVY